MGTLSLTRDKNKNEGEHRGGGRVKARDTCGYTAADSRQYSFVQTAAEGKTSYTIISIIIRVEPESWPVISGLRKRIIILKRK